MPCRTVVFAGDSVLLHIGIFRQMMGRAGRRGFDPCGNVIFLGFPRLRLERLLSAAVPELRGSMPLSTTMVLRLLTALHESKDPGLHKSIFKLLNTPFYCTGKESLKDQVRL
jgi:superfamily II RNA helicase